MTVPTVILVTSQLCNRIFAWRMIFEYNQVVGILEHPQGGQHKKRLIESLMLLVKTSSVLHVVQSDIRDVKWRHKDKRSDWLRVSNPGFLLATSIPGRWEKSEKILWDGANARPFAWSDRKLQTLLMQVLPAQHQQALEKWMMMSQRLRKMKPETCPATKRVCTALVTSELR